MSEVTVGFDVEAATIAYAAFVSGGTATNLSDQRFRAMPVSIPRDQVYYWSTAWQEGERRAGADLRAGRSQTFDNPSDAIRYLFRTDA